MEGGRKSKRRDGPTGPIVHDLTHECEGEEPKEGEKQLYEVIRERRKTWARCPKCGKWSYLGKSPRD